MALDPSYFFYNDGTITLTNGSDIATGELVAWDPAVLPFDFVFPNNGVSGMAVIKEVLAVDQIKLAAPWSGPTLTDVPYFMVRWTKHTDPRIYALRVSEYLTRIRPLPEVGPPGWSPIIAVVADGARRVLQVIDWTATGTTYAKPPVGRYIGATGLVTDIAQAIDIRGPQGIQGVQGIHGGGMTARYSYSSTLTNADPGAGFLRGNNATFASSTQLYVSNTNGSSAAFGAALDTFDDSTSTSLRGHIQITSESDPSKFAIFAVTGAVTANTGYKTIAVAPVASNGTFANNEAMVLSFVRTGNLGNTGAQGAHGGLTARYTFSTTTTDADPGTGFLRLSAAVNAATVLRASNTALNSVAFGPIMDTFDDSTSAVKGFIRLQHETDLTKWALYSVTAVASPAGYKNISIAHVGSGTAFANNDPIVLSFMRTGDQGDKGWSPVFSIVSDSARRVLQVTDWVGGAGTKPATGSYVGPTGLVSDIAQAVDIRGPAGGAVGANSVDNTLLADMPTGRIKGRAAAGTGDPEDLTADQVTALLGFAQSSAAAGYVKLPGGIIVQWGSTTGGGGVKTFPLAFPNACFAVVANAKVPTLDAGTGVICVADTFTKTDFTLRMRYVTAGGAVNLSTADAQFFAIGN